MNLFPPHTPSPPRTPRRYYIGRPIEIANLLARTLPAQSTFFINLVMLTGLSVLPLEVLQVNKWEALFPHHRLPFFVSYDIFPWSPFPTQGCTSRHHQAQALDSCGKHLGSLTSHDLLITRFSCIVSPFLFLSFRFPRRKSFYEAPTDDSGNSLYLFALLCLPLPTHIGTPIHY